MTIEITGSLKAITEPGSFKAYGLSQRTYGNRRMQRYVSASGK